MTVKQCLLAVLPASFFLGAALPAAAQVIKGRELVMLNAADVVHEITINSAVATTVHFPEKITFLTGFGMVQDPNAAVSMGKEKVTVVQYDNSMADTLVVRMLKAGEPCHATVRTGRHLHLLRFIPGDSANLAVIVPPPESRNTTVETTPQDVVKARINFSSEELVGILSKAKNRKALQIHNPGLFSGWDERNGLNMATTSNNVTTTIYEIQRWQTKDATVFRCWVTNQGEAPFEFEPDGVRVRVGARTYPSQLVDCSGIVHPGQRIPLDVVLQGNVSGGREALSIHQDFRVELPGEGRGRASAALFGDATADGK